MPNENKHKAAEAKVIVFTIFIFNNITTCMYNDQMLWQLYDWMLLNYDIVTWYCLVGNFCGVLIFYIFVVDLAYMKIFTHEK